MPPKHIAVLAVPRVQMLDVSGPLQVFASAAALVEQAGGKRPYEVEVIGLETGPVITSSGVEIMARRALRDGLDGIDTLLVAGGPGIHAVTGDQTILTALRAAPGRVRRLGSVCTGAFLLAATGLLDGCRAVTHWRHCAQLAQAYPAVTVEADALHVKDGGLYSSAGVTAGMDLALALVEEDFGRNLALNVARHLVLFLKRPGGQSQFSTHLAGQMAEATPLEALGHWIADNCHLPLTVEDMAAQAGMSPRNFARIFTRCFRTTPARFLEMTRLEAARRKLEESGLPAETIAGLCGFGNAERMRRTFLRHLAVSPQAYRDRFQSKGVQ